MKNLKFRPKFDKLFLGTMVPTLILILGLLIMTAIWQSTGGWIVMAGTFLFTAYFFVSPFFGYVELRETAVFVKFGFFLRQEIPYESIRGIEIKRSIISDSMLSLKNAMEHVSIKHGRFDATSVSVVNNDELISEIEARIKAKIHQNNPNL